MSPFLLGLLGWTVLLLWGWIQVGRSLDDSVRDEATAETRPAAASEGNRKRDFDNVIPTTYHD
ncbi:hypothetical protein GGQ07_002912 [Salinibacter ruber]|uniref:hypothetical protein n=1 Tax=Salinibacter ruber TaxID=146919 RepID=UPI002169C3AA|nr:hypothetical protein [Salinibacter ruber]MCS4116077.1 hypothetical protein [Salinibacter ruber]MCS4181455.1 hypothetical protein [Salinibacter ruber]